MKSKRLKSKISKEIKDLIYSIDKSSEEEEAEEEKYVYDASERELEEIKQLKVHIAQILKSRRAVIELLLKKIELRD